jgi:hypothetical protein
LDIEWGVVRRLVTFERKVLRRNFGGIEINENWRKAI